MGCLANVCVVFILALALVDYVDSHARLIQPPGRSTAWRYGFDTSKNYNDAALNCGGKNVQWDTNNGKCGVCGDRYDAASKPHEDLDGKYVKNRAIVAEYKQGSTFTATMEATAYHKGWLEYRLCALPNSNTIVTQECLDRHLLKLKDSDVSRIDLEAMRRPGNGNGEYTVELQLPADVTCDSCVLQMWYKAGNSWGCEANGDCCLGCAAQETFVNCADIKILPANGVQGGTTSGGSSQNGGSSAGNKEGNAGDEWNQSPSGPTTNPKDGKTNNYDRKMLVAMLKSARANERIAKVLERLTSVLEEYYGNK